MFSVNSKLTLPIILLSIFSLAGCGGITDDLLPSGDDNRPDVIAGGMGSQVTEQSPDFSVKDTLGVDRGLYTELTGSGGVVLYFTMWCPICDTHSSHMRAQVMPDFPTVKFFLVDYVTGSVSASRSAQLSNGYAGIETLVDVDQSLLNLYQATMGTTVVIDSVGNIVHMNEDYKDGVKLKEVLGLLP